MGKHAPWLLHRQQHALRPVSHLHGVTLLTPAKGTAR